jgi:hypothetical protein
MVVAPRAMLGVARSKNRWKSYMKVGATNESNLSEVLNEILAVCHKSEHIWVVTTATG